MKPPIKDKLSELVDEDIWRTLTKTEKKRQEIIHELMNTERGYVRDLDIITTVFIKGISERALLNKEEVTSIFANTQTLMEVHLELLQELEALRDSSPGHLVQEGIGEIFLKRISLFKYYAAYSSNHLTITDKVKAFTNRSPLFKAFLDVSSPYALLQKSTILI